MYQIISISGDIIAETDSPTYTKFNPISQTWIPANDDDAECVVAGGKKFTIYGKPFNGDSRQIVFIKKIDTADKISYLQHKFNLDNLDIIEAIIQLDKRLEALENAKTLS